MLDKGLGALTGDRLDAAQSGTDAALGDYLEKTDLAGGGDMGAAAKLGAD